MGQLEPRAGNGDTLLTGLIENSNSTGATGRTAMVTPTSGRIKRIVGAFITASTQDWTVNIVTPVGTVAFTVEQPRAADEGWQVEIPDVAASYVDAGDAIILQATTQSLGVGEVDLTIVVG